MPITIAKTSNILVQLWASVYKQLWAWASLATQDFIALSKSEWVSYEQLWLHALMQGGWTGVLAAARYGHPETLRDLIGEFGCNRNAVKPVSHMYELQLWVIMGLNVMPSDIYNIYNYTCLMCQTA